MVWLKIKEKKKNKGNVFHKSKIKVSASNLLTKLQTEKMQRPAHLSVVLNRSLIGFQYYC